MSKSPDEIIHSALLEHAYDPKKAHDYYEAHKHLKGRKSGGKVIPLKGRPVAKHDPSANHISPAMQQQINSIKSRLAQLQTRLRELLANQRDESKKSDHKTAAEKSKDARESKKYREEHKTELAQKRKQDAKSGGGSSSSGGISSMTETEVRAAIARTRSDLQAAVAKARAASRGTA